MRAATQANQVASNEIQPHFQERALVAFKSRPILFFMNKYVLTIAHLTGCFHCVRRVGAVDCYAVACVHGSREDGGRGKEGDYVHFLLLCPLLLLRDQQTRSVYWKNK